MDDPTMAQFRSCEETLAILAALIVGAVAQRVFGAQLRGAAAIGLVTGAVVAYATFAQFTLKDGVVTYRNLPRQQSFPVAWVETARMSTHWAGLPGHLFMFRMRSPPAAVNGYFLRTGLASWPSASHWLDVVNGAAREAKVDGR
jgi:hypothetical protein